MTDLPNKPNSSGYEHLIDREIDSSIFDVTYNMQSTSVEEITDLIIRILQKRALVPAEMAIAH